MEEIKDILDSIKKHTTAEADAYALNRTIGRGLVKIGRVPQKVVWVANVGYQTTNQRYNTEDGRVEVIMNPTVHTYTGDGVVISKNTAQGRYLMENYSGSFSFVAPAGRLTMDVLNAAYYTQQQGRNTVTDLSIGIDGQPRLLHFKDLNSAFSSYLKLLKDNNDAKELIAEREKRLEVQRKAEEEAKFAAQKARNEDERKLRIEALRKAEEERRKTEAEIRKHKEELSLRVEEAKKYEETYGFIRMQASLRLNPRLDSSQNSVKFSHIFDGITTIIEGGPGTGKSTTLIQRMKLLIDANDLEDYRINHPEANLTPKMIEIASARSGWAFFSPTDLLCKYLKEDMAYEGLSQYEDKTHVWKDYLRKTLIRDDYKIAGAKCRFAFTNKYGEDGLFIGDQIQVVKDFQQYYLNALKNRLLKVADTDYSTFSWKILGKMIADTCRDAGKAEDLPAIYRILFKLNGLKDQMMPVGVPSAKDIVSTYELRVDEITNRYLVEWKKDREFYSMLLDAEDDILDSDDTTVAVEDVDEDDTVDKTDDTAIELQRDVKRLIRRIASSKDDASLVIEPLYQELYGLLRDRIKRTELKQISDIAFFNKEVYPCISNVEVFLLNVDFICNTYLTFRKECLSSQDTNWNLNILEKMVNITSKNYIHHDECCLLIGTINNILKRLAKFSEERFNSFNGRFANAYRKHRKAVVGIDEATDYSLIDYYAMSSLRHHVVSAVTLSGDMMQSMNEFGIKDWKALQNQLLFEKVDVMNLKMSYRQGPKLIKLAHYLYHKATGKRAPYSCYLKDEKMTPDPLWFKSNELEEKALWIAKRVLEVQKAYDKVPSIAIFVNDEKEAQQLHAALKGDELLENAGIDVINCTANDELTAPDSIRIFLLDRVKGMEFEVVFFYNIDKVAKSKLIDQYLYVGLSRATFYMAVASNEFDDNPQLIELSERFSKQTKWKQRKRQLTESIENDEIKLELEKHENPVIPAEEPEEVSSANTDDEDETSLLEWHFVESVPFTKSSKRFLSYKCRVVLSESGYYLEVGNEYIKLGDYADGFDATEGNIWIKKPVDEKGYRLVHDTEEDMYLIGYLREEGNIVTFTDPEGEEYTITF